jgi:hypothetical protein
LRFEFFNPGCDFLMNLCGDFFAVNNSCCHLLLASRSSWPVIAGKLRCRIS